MPIPVTLTLGYLADMCLSGFSAESRPALPSSALDSGRSSYAQVSLKDLLFSILRGRVQEDFQANPRYHVAPCFKIFDAFKICISKGKDFLPPHPLHLTIFTMSP